MRYADIVLTPDAEIRVRAIKCLVWDLDGTLWSDVLLEGGAGCLADGVETVLRTLDARGIVQSIASKNDYAVAWAQIEALGVAHYFLYPQIGWNSKAASIERIASSLNLGLDAVGFIDDQAVELDEVAFYLPQVSLFHASNMGSLLDDPRLNPRFVTAESRHRRLMYHADGIRQAAQEQFDGSRDAFLATLKMRMTIRRATVTDLERAEELTVRTNQLNTTGRTYSHDELAALLASPNHLVLVASLDDVYGQSGTIGLALIDLKLGEWVIRLLIMSCRVMARGVGTVLLGDLVRRAQRHGVVLRAVFVPTARNRQMLVTFKFAGFRTIVKHDDEEVLEHDPARTPAVPAFVELCADDAPTAAGR